MLETVMEIQIQALIGSKRWGDNRNRGGYRNGCYYRDLLTSYGHLANLQVPGVREGSIDYGVIKKYQRRSKEVDEQILEMFLSGVSARRVEEVVVPLYGEKSE